MGKSTPSVIVGYEYRLGLHVVLGAFPINAIHEIRCDNKVLKQGTFSGGTLDIDNPTFFEGGEVADGMAGNIDLHIDGAEAFNNYLRNNYGIPFERVPRFDQVAHLVFRGIGTGDTAGGYYIGNQPRPREMTVFAERTATQCPYDEWALLPYTHPKWGFEVNDFNPLVMHWQMIQRGNTDAYGATWEAAAEVLHGENFGISAAVGGGDRDALEQEICRYINARPYIDRATGLREIRLIRADYDADTLPVIGEGDILGEPQITLPDRSQAVNTLEITYSDRAKMWDKASVTVQDGAHAEAFGVRRGSPVDYKWVTRRQLAADLGWRDVVAQTQAGVAGTVRVSGLRPDLNEGSPFILDLPSYGQSTVVGRIVAIRERGARDNSVDVTFIQDVFGVDVAPIVEEDVPSSGGTDGGGDTGTVAEALPAPVEAAMEVPYWFGATRYGSDFTSAVAADDDFGALMTAASAPSGLYLGYDVWTAVGAGAYAKRATGAFAGAGALSGAVTRMQTSIVTTPISGLAVGDVLLIGGAEFVRVDAITPGATYTLTVGRGCIDTAPIPHADGAEVLSLKNALPIEQEFTAGQTVNAKLLTFLSGDTMALSEATALPVTMDSRAIRPYPPGQFKVGGSYDDGTTLSGDPVLTWVARNRLVQTDETHADDHSEAGITAEVGTTYVVRAEAFNGGGASLGYVPGFSALDVGSVLTYTPALIAAPPPVGTASVALSVAAKRGGFESWTAPAIRANLAALPPWGSSFVAIDNGAAAYSRMTGAVGLETIRKMVIGIRFRFDNGLANCKVFGDAAGTTLSLLQPTSSAIRLNSAFGSIRPAWTVDTSMHTHLLSFDMTTANAVQWWLDGTQLLNNSAGTGGTFTTGTYDTASFGLNSASNGLGLFNEWDGGAFAGSMDGAVEMLWIDWGDATYTLPDITNSTIRAKFGAAQINADGSGPTGASPKLFYAAASLTEANSAGGIPNRGSLASRPMVKQTGTYT